MELAKIWLNNARNVMNDIENSQMENIVKAAGIMADTIQSEHWVHLFGCGHATLPVEEMYPRIGGFTMCAYIELEGGKYIYANAYGAGVYDEDDYEIDLIQLDEINTGKVAEVIANYLKGGK